MSSAVCARLPGASAITRLSGAITTTRLSGAIIAVALATATAASASTVRIQEFAQNQVAAAQAAHTSFMASDDAAVFGAGGHYGTRSRIHEHRTETFAGFHAWDGVTGTSNPVNTAVGSFESLGGVGRGHSAINGGTGLEVRNEDPMRWGRHSVLNPGGNWLDSNDTYGMRWEVGGLGSFNALTFFLTDVGDVGGKFSLNVGGKLYENVIGGDGPVADGTIHWVKILLNETVSSLTLEFGHDRLNDGFGIDGVTVAHIAPIPVPPAAALMVTGALVLVGLRRRQGRRQEAAAAA